MWLHWQLVQNHTTWASVALVISATYWQLAPQIRLVRQLRALQVFVIHSFIQLTSECHSHAKFHYDDQVLMCSPPHPPLLYYTAWDLSQVDLMLPHNMTWHCLFTFVLWICMVDHPAICAVYLQILVTKVIRDHVRGLTEKTWVPVFDCSVSSDPYLFHNSY